MVGLGVSIVLNMEWRNWLGWNPSMQITLVWPVEILGKNFLALSRLSRCNQPKENVKILVDWLSASNHAMPAEDNKLFQSSDGIEGSPQYSKVSTFFVSDLLKNVKSDANNQV